MMRRCCYCPIMNAVSSADLPTFAEASAGGAQLNSKSPRDPTPAAFAL